MKNNYRSLIPGEINTSCKVKKWDKAVKLAKEGTVIEDKSEGIMVGTMVYNAIYDEVRVNCHSYDKNGNSKYECHIILHSDQSVEVEYSYDFGEIEWKIKTFEAGENEYENECKEKILAILDYLVNEELIVFLNNTLR